MDGLRKICSLEDKASAQVAINLCQENGFKEVALCLEKPTYGGFISYRHPNFVSDPEKLLIWAKIKNNYLSLDAFAKSCYLSNTEKVRLWDAAVDEQCERLTEGIPSFLRQGVHAWINRIALEYLSYSRRQEVLFGVSRYFLMDIFTRGDWKEAGRFDEQKLAQRLLEDDQLTLLQRYRIACSYCLHDHISQLWERLTQEEKHFTRGKAEHGLVLLWSRRYREEKVAWRENHLWTHAAREAACYGNLATLMLCWTKLKEQQQKVIDMALHSLQQWELMRKISCGSCKARLVSNYFPTEQRASSIMDFNLPSYYTELMRFFLSQMDEDQQLTFFKKAFQISDCDSVLEYFFDWPHQDYFLSTINRLWGIIPKDKYGQCLLALASKYSGNDEKENRYNDYRGLLGTLWEETPEEYRQYVFRNKEVNYSAINEGKVLLNRLLKRSPFQQKDEALFKRIFCDQPQEERRAMMHSEVGKNMCSTLKQKEKWSFLDWLLEECLPQKEIPSFKEQFIQSKCGRKRWLDELKENRERLVEDLIDWSLELNREKTRFKNGLIRGEDCCHACKTFLRKVKSAKVERVINFRSSSDGMTERSKVRFARYACSALLEGCGRGSGCIWKHMDTIVAWSVDTEKKIRDLKKNLFSSKGIDTHYELVFIQRRWEKVEGFYQWFGLSPEEIKKLKKYTLFKPEVIEDIHEDLPEYTNTLVASLRWCLTDEEMVIDLKKKVEEECFKQVLNKREEKKKERLDHLVRELLDGFRKEVRTRRIEMFLRKIKEKKSSVVIEDEPSSPRKRCK